VQELRPNVALSYYSLSVFQKPLLDSFDQTVNYHDALLPSYRGLMTTAWFIYRGEQESGFTFHHMNEALDDGNILIQGSVPVPSDARLTSIARAKKAGAIPHLPQLMRMPDNRQTRRPQTGSSSYFSRADLMGITRIDAPETLELAEFKRRLDAFGAIQLRHNGRWYSVTDWITSANAKNSLSFRTRDRQRFTPTRIEGLPLWLHRLTTPNRHAEKPSELFQNSQPGEDAGATGSPVRTRDDPE